MKIITLCGSIRKASSNHSILKAVHSFFPEKTEWVDFDIQVLPYFDPQNQFGEKIPKPVIELRKEVQSSNYIFIATPEYAHGIPGILKNALEWLVCEETMKKKVIVFIGTTSSGDFVREYLLETLRTMDMEATPEMTFTIRGARSQISEAGEIIDPVLKATMEKFISPFLNE